MPLELGRRGEFFLPQYGHSWRLLSTAAGLGLPLGRPPPEANWRCNGRPMEKSRPLPPPPAKGSTEPSAPKLPLPPPPPLPARLTTWSILGCPSSSVCTSDSSNPP